MSFERGRLLQSQWIVGAAGSALIVPLQRGQGRDSVQGARSSPSHPGHRFIPSAETISGALVPTTTSTTSRQALQTMVSVRIMNPPSAPPLTSAV